MENNRPYLEITWAAQRCGLYYTAVNRRLNSAEVQYILDDCGASVLVAGAAMEDVIAGLDLSRVTTRICAVGGLPGFEDYQHLLDASSAAPLGRGPGDALLVGNDGAAQRDSQGAGCHPLGDPTSAPVRIAKGLLVSGLTDGPVYLSPAPLYHGAPLVFSMSWHRLGGKVIVMERFDAREFLELVQRYRVTHTQLVPTMFIRLLRLPADERTRYDVSSLVDVVHSAAPCPVPVKRQMLDWWGPIISEYYSGTEDVGHTHITAQEWLAHPGSVGRPREECHIVDEDGDELPPGRIGVVYFVGGRGSEYHRDPAKTAAATHARGWRTLGDIGYLDDDGYLYLPTASRI